MRKCKYCGKEIIKSADLMGIWSDPDAHIFCYPYGGSLPGFHEPFAGVEVVNKVLEKYGQES